MGTPHTAHTREGSNHPRPTGPEWQHTNADLPDQVTAKGFLSGGAVERRLSLKSMSKNYPQKALVDRIQTAIRTLEYISTPPYSSHNMQLSLCLECTVSYSVFIYSDKDPVRKPGLHMCEPFYTCTLAKCSIHPPLPVSCAVQQAFKHKNETNKKSR